MDTLLSALLLFGGAIFWTWAVLITFVIACFAADIAKNGFWATAALVLLGGVYFFFGHYKDVLALITWQFAFGYLLIGFLYSILRTIVEGAKLGKRVRGIDTYAIKLANAEAEAQANAKREYDIRNVIDRDANVTIDRYYRQPYVNYDDTRDGAIKNYKKELKNNAARWLFLWWISVITWFLGDLLKDLWDAVYHFFKNFYERMLDYGIRLTLGKFEITEKKND